MPEREGLHGLSPPPNLRNKHRRSHPVAGIVRLLPRIAMRRFRSLHAPRRIAFGRPLRDQAAFFRLHLASQLPKGKRVKSMTERLLQGHEMAVPFAPGAGVVFLESLAKRFPKPPERWHRISVSSSLPRSLVHQTPPPEWQVGEHRRSRVTPGNGVRASDPDRPIRRRAYATMTV